MGPFVRTRGLETEHKSVDHNGALNFQQLPHDFGEEAGLASEFNEARISCYSTYASRVA